MFGKGFFGQSYYGGDYFGTLISQDGVNAAAAAVALALASTNGTEFVLRNAAGGLTGLSLFDADGTEFTIHNIATAPIGTALFDADGNEFTIIALEGYRPAGVGLALFSSDGTEFAIRGVVKTLFGGAFIIDPEPIVLARAFADAVAEAVLSGSGLFAVFSGAVAVGNLTSDDSEFVIRNAIATSVAVALADSLIAQLHAASANALGQETSFEIDSFVFVLRRVLNENVIATGLATGGIGNFRDSAGDATSIASLSDAAFALRNAFISAVSSATATAAPEFDLEATANAFAEAIMAGAAPLSKDITGSMLAIADLLGTEELAEFVAGVFILAQRNTDFAMAARNFIRTNARGVTLAQQVRGSAFRLTTRGTDFKLPLRGTALQAKLKI